MGVAEVNERLLLAVALVVLLARLLGWLVGRLGHPRVMGEILAGLLLGPSLLGALWPEAMAYAFPPDVVDALSAVAQLGLVLFMFLIGAELDFSQLRAEGRRAIVISQASIVVPMTAGFGLAWWLHPRFGTGVNRFGFCLFVGAAMSITAFPVLARLLRDSGLSSTRIGALALTCAAIDDVTAWGVLAVVVAVVTASGAAEVVLVVLWTILFLAVMIGVVRPLLMNRRWLSMPLVIALALGSAWVTEMIGIHAIFGAFVAGAITPQHKHEDLDITGRLETATSTVLLPVFFVVAGLSAEVGLLRTPYLWGVTLLVLAVAVVGKLGGATIAARFIGETPRDALTLGVLMNTRGLTELVILTVGLELGVIGPTLFTMMLLMALVTTFMAWPIVRRLQPDVRLPGSSGGGLRERG